jgi:16S rRNA A1518/A1519 N6-dimethyltransferase RsmA/KsgA/DIM1 with predicted DNA glycosylase/AP lyase activity
VDSSFITFARRSPAAGGAADGEPALSREQYAAMSPLVKLAFGQRRKVLTNTLAGASRGGLSVSRDAVRAALAELDLGQSARPEELTPGQWVLLARCLGWFEAPAPGLTDGAGHGA